jgi:hypothetical protein
MAADSMFRRLYGLSVPDRPPEGTRTGSIPVITTPLALPPGYHEGEPLRKEAVMLDNTSPVGSHFLALPSTKLGRASAGLFLVGLVAFVASLLLSDGTQIRLGPIDPVATAMLVGFVGAFVVGAVALIASHERSWAVWGTTLLPILVIAGDVVLGLLVGGG